MAIYVDFDGTLAHYDGWKGHNHFGPPVWDMVERIKGWIANGKIVKIFTARVCNLYIDPKEYPEEYSEALEARMAIQQYLTMVCALPKLDVTAIKHFECDEFYDDRAVQVEENTGKIIGYSRRGNV